MSGIDAIRTAFDQAEDIDFGYDPDPRTPEFGPQDFGGDDPLSPPPIDNLGLIGALFPLNDYGNGKRFGLYYGADILFVPRVGWFVWDGRVWAADDDKLEVRRAAQKIAERITQEAELIHLEDWEQDLLDLRPGAVQTRKDLMAQSAAKRSDSDKARLREMDEIIDRADGLKAKLSVQRRSHKSHAKASGNTGLINNMMLEAQVENYVALARLNTDPLMINTETGVLQFVGGGIKKGNDWAMDILPHARDQYLSKMMPVAFDVSAICPDFMAFLRQILPDPDVREFMQRWLGYSLTGRTDEQKLAFFYGGGRNGKSTLVDLIAKMMGAYATTVPIETLTGSETRKGSDATPDLVRLPGARMVRASEPENGQKMKEAMIKSLTGGEAIMVRKMQQEFVEVNPEFKLTISGNLKPEIRGTDDGIWRRILLVPFTVQIAHEDVDLDLPAKLWAERSGILNWLLEGAGKWLKDGLMVPASVAEATEGYRMANDPVAVFMNEECIIDGDPTRFERGRDLRDAFNFWLEAQGLDKWGARTIANHFKDKQERYKSATGHGITAKKISDTGYGGITIKDGFKDRMEQDEINARYSER